MKVQLILQEVVAKIPTKLCSHMHFHHCAQHKYWPIKFDSSFLNINTKNISSSNVLQQHSKHPISQIGIYTINLHKNGNFNKS